MAAVGNSFIDDSKCSDVSCGSPASSVRRSEESLGDQRDDVVTSSELTVDKLYSASSLRDGVARDDDVIQSYSVTCDDDVIQSSSKLRVDELYSASSLRDGVARDDDVIQSSNCRHNDELAGNDSVSSPCIVGDSESFCDSGLTVDKLPESEVKHSSSDLLAAAALAVSSCERQRSHSRELSASHRCLLHSTPAVHLSEKSSNCTPVIGSLSTDTPVIGNTSTGTPVIGSLSNGTPAIGSSSNGAPVIGSSSTSTPVIGSSSTGTPVIGSLSNGTPVIGSSSTSTPVIDDTSNGAPVIDSSSTGTSVIGSLSNGTPVIGSSSTSTPVIDNTSNGAPVIGSLSNGAPVVGSSSLGTPVVGSSSSGTPVVGSSSTGIPVVGSSSSGTPVIGSSSSGIPVVGSSSTGIPVVGSSSSGIPVVGNSSTGTPVVGSSSSGTPVVGSSSSGIPVVGSSSTGTPVSVRPSPAGGCDCQSSVTRVAAVEPLSVVSTGHCDELTWHCSSVRCQPPPAAAAAAAAVDEDARDDKAIASCRMAVDDVREDVSATSSKAAENEAKKNRAADGCHRHTWFKAVSASEEANRDLAACDRDLTDGPSPINITDSHCLQPHMTDRRREQLGELMERQCVIGDSCDELSDRVMDGSIEVLASEEADVTDSFDLDAATKDLEQAVSAGMLDFLLESCEDVDVELSSEQLCAGLDDWEPVLSSSDDSESTLTDDDGRLADAADADTESGDTDVWRRHERIRRRLRNAVDHRAPDSDHDIDSASDDDDDFVDSDADVDDYDDAELKTIVCGVHGGHPAPSGDLSSSDIESASDVVDGTDNSGDDTDVRDVGGTDAALKPCDGARRCVKSSDHSSADSIICARDDGSSDDDDVLMRHARVRLLPAAADCASCKASDADPVRADVNCRCIDVDRELISAERRLKSVDNIGTADTVDTGFVGSADDAQIAVTKDQLTATNESVSVSNDNLESVHCRNVGKMSSVVAECKLSDKLRATSSVKPTVCRKSSVAGDVDKTELSGETSLSDGELGARSTSTPSGCSHRSLPTCRCSVIEWREGVYNGLCRHSDGSEIRMSHDHGDHLLAKAGN